MGHIITIAQQKGGAGKTTVTIQLAMALYAAGRSVALLDSDPQGSLATWFEFRQNNGLPCERLSQRQAEGWRLSSEARQLAKDHDYVFIDTPPHAEKTAIDAIKLSDIVLLPAQLSPMDIWAVNPTLNMARGQSRDFYLVLNRVPPRGKMAEELRHALGAFDVPVFQSSLGNRQDFASSLILGKGVIESAPRGRAAAEIKALAKELEKEIKSRA